MLPQVEGQTVSRRFRHRRQHFSLDGVGLFIYEAHRGGKGNLPASVIPIVHQHASINIGRNGYIALIYSPPVSMGISEDGVRRKIKGVEYSQSTIDIPGTVEGVRVQVKGTVDGAPRPVAQNIRNSPLMFFLIEPNPKDEKHPVYHEVWATKSARSELQRAKLIKGSEIEAVLYRKVLDVTTIGGGRETVTRNYLAKLIYVSKRPKG